MQRDYTRKKPELVYLLVPSGVKKLALGKYTESNRCLLHSVHLTTRKVDGGDKEEWSDASSKKDQELHNDDP